MDIRLIGAGLFILLLAVGVGSKVVSSDNKPSDPVPPNDSTNNPPRINEAVVRIDGYLTDTTENRVSGTKVWVYPQGVSCRATHGHLTSAESGSDGSIMLMYSSKVSEVQDQQPGIDVEDDVVKFCVASGSDYYESDTLHLDTIKEKYVIGNHWLADSGIQIKDDSNVIQFRLFVESISRKKAVA